MKGKARLCIVRPSVHPVAKGMNLEWIKNNISHQESEKDTRLYTQPACNTRLQKKSLPRYNIYSIQDDQPISVYRKTCPLMFPPIRVVQRTVFAARAEMEIYKRKKVKS